MSLRRSEPEAGDAEPREAQTHAAPPSSEADDGRPEVEGIVPELFERIRDLERQLVATRRLVEAVLRLAIPLALLAALLLLVFLLQPDSWKRAYTLMVLFTFTPAGKFTAGVFIQQGFSFWETVVILGSIDLFVGMLLVWNLPVIYRIPRIGTALARAERRGRKGLRQHAWIRRTAFLGLALFVAVPFQGTGAVIGAIVGRILGLGAARTIGAIALGGYGGVAAVAGITVGIFEVGRINVPLAIGVALVAVALFLLGRMAWNRTRTAARGAGRKGKAHKPKRASRREV